MRARPARSLQARQARCRWRWSDCVARRSSSEGRAPCQVPRLRGDVGPTSFCASFTSLESHQHGVRCRGCAVLARKARARAAGRGRRTHALKRINNDKGPRLERDETCCIASPPRTSSTAGVHRRRLLSICRRRGAWLLPPNDNQLHPPCVLRLRTVSCTCTCTSRVTRSGCYQTSWRLHMSTNMNAPLTMQSQQ